MAGPAVPASACPHDRGFPRGHRETLRGLYDIDSPLLAGADLGALSDDLTDTDCPPELRGLGRPLARWHVAIVNWHRAQVSNWGPAEAINNRVNRVAFGFRRFAHYRVRALLYADKPDWTLLVGLTGTVRWGAPGIARSG